MAPALWIVGMLLAHALVSVSAPVLAQQQAAVLDFEYFRTEVQPILSTKREGYTRCVVCHSADNAVGFLQPLAPGATTWDTEQSRENFDRVSALVMPGEPMKSRLLLHPLEPAAGGDEFHNGGRQFTSQDDPAFQTIAAWIRGQSAAGPAQ